MPPVLIHVFLAWICFPTRHRFYYGGCLTLLTDSGSQLCLEHLSAPRQFLDCTFLCPILWGSSSCCCLSYVSPLFFLLFRICRTCSIPHALFHFFDFLQYGQVDSLESTLCASCTGTHFLGCSNGLGTCADFARPSLCALLSLLLPVGFIDPLVCLSSDDLFSLRLVPVILASFSSRPNLSRDRFLNRFFSTLSSSGGDAISAGLVIVDLSSPVHPLVCLYRRGFLFPARITHQSSFVSKVFCLHAFRVGILPAKCARSDGTILPVETSCYSIITTLAMTTFITHLTSVVG